MIVVLLASGVSTRNFCCRGCHNNQGLVIEYNVSRDHVFLSQDANLPTQIDIITLSVTFAKDFVEMRHQCNSDCSREDRIGVVLAAITYCKECIRKSHPRIREMRNFACITTESVTDTHKTSVLNHSPRLFPQAHTLSELSVATFLEEDSPGT